MAFGNQHGAVLEKRLLIPLSPADLAEAFCEMDDDQQAQFFVEAARIIRSWPEPIARQLQPVLIGKHLGKCECSTEDARSLIRDIAIAMTPAPGADDDPRCPRCYSVDAGRRSGLCVTCSGIVARGGI